MHECIKWYYVITSASLNNLVGSESEFRAHYRRPDADLMEKFRQRVFQCFNIDAKPRQVASAGSSTLPQQARAGKSGACS